MVLDVCDVVVRPWRVTVFWLNVVSVKRVHAAHVGSCVHGSCFGK